MIFLRIIGFMVGSFFIAWGWIQFRRHLIQRGEFFIRLLLGIVLLAIVIYPGIIKIFAGMLLLEGKQFGRLIMLLIFSNFLIWIFIFGLRSTNFKKSVDFDLLVRYLAQRLSLAADDLNKIKKITVIIPAFNEVENLDHILPKMPDSINGQPLGVLVVDDGSVDDTVEMVEKHGYQVVSNPINRGGGAALRLGYDISVAGGAKIIVTMDGDGQHLPEEIEQLIKPIEEDKADIVIGSRILGKREKDNVVRWMGIHIFNIIINFLAGTKITDCSSGFRAFRVDSLEKIFLCQDQFHTAELIIDASKKGLRISEVPITMLRRYSGESKKGKDWNYGLNFSKTVLKTWLRK